MWQDVQGVGTVKGDPHRGTHTWPEMNSAMLVMVDDEKVPKIMQAIKKLIPKISSAYLPNTIRP